MTLGWIFLVVLCFGLFGLSGMAGVASLAAQTVDPDLYSGMKWRLVGPFRGGRAVAGTGVPGDANTFYFGAVGGGVWKTTSGGLNWEPIFDKEPIASIGAIAVAPSDPNILYVGTGEACIRGDISFGNGVYKSLDAGKTWMHIGLDDTRHIGAVIVDPHDSNIVFVAALGHAYGPNIERGLFRTIDGGKTWQKVLYKDERTGAIDVVFDPNNSHILFAALWEACRTPWSLTSGGPGSGLYRSGDGGITWKRLEGHGLPAGLLGRIGVTVSGGDSNRIYAMIEAERAGLYRSDDGGTNWMLVNDDHRLHLRPWYFSHIFADPKSPNIVYVLHTGLSRSTDGGYRFEVIGTPHSDHHDLWIDPTDTRRMIDCNDGGATITTDGGKTWSTEDNQPTAPFYHVIADNRFPYYIYGCPQDNTSVAIASASERGAIGPGDWYAVGGGESGYIAPDPEDPNIVYAGNYFGTVTRYDRRNWQEQNIMPWPEEPDGHAAAEMKYRFNWTEPIVISPHDHNVLYMSAQVLFKSTDGGMNWTVIGPDLTRNDKSKQQVSGGPLTKDNTSVEFYDVIFSVAESPVEKDLIWAGTDDGLVHLTRDGGKNWANVTPKEMPEWGMVSLIDPSPHDAGTAYIAVDRHKMDDFHPYIFKTTDFGMTWTKITGGLPEDRYVHAVREDPLRKGLLFAGTETGIWVSFDSGDHWQSVQLNLPTTPIYDLVVKDGDLVVATHGRAFWILDNITPLRQATAGMSGDDVRLFAPRPGIRLRTSRYFRLTGPGGQNPPIGAVIDYYLKEKADDPITLEITDNRGRLARRFTSRSQPEAASPLESSSLFPRERPVLSAEAGMHRFIWDLRYDESIPVPGAVYAEGRPLGPLAVPGKYAIKLTVAGKSYTAPLEVKLDPRVKTSQSDLEKQFDLMTEMRDRQSQMNGVILQLRDVRKQLVALGERLAGDASNKSVRDAGQSLTQKLTDIEEHLVQTKSVTANDEINYPSGFNSKLAFVQNAVDSADTAPTRAELEVFDEYKKYLDEQITRWQEVISKDLPALNDTLQKEKIPAIGPASARGKTGTPR
jgi:photosystem II stability/assembly factor-like uncharacterized protein